jgi:hypothetical protein
MAIKEINGEEYLIPEGLNINPHKHRDADNWISLWFYRGRRRNKVTQDQILPDKVITSKLDYQKNIFYKMSSMSREDEHFDYYFRLKEDTPKNLVKKNTRYKKINPKKKVKFKEYKSPPYKKDKDGKYIVTFH